jgi:succinate dehydrogenase / fumarate reductase iron-sulfur subunit
MALTVKIRRFDPSVDQTAHFAVFEVSLFANAEWTALDVLDYIHFHIDSSLSYYRHSTCKRGICARCAAFINGKTRLLCEYSVPTQGELVLEPVPGKDIVKDLVWT